MLRNRNHIILMMCKSIIFYVLSIAVSCRSDEEFAQLPEMQDAATPTRLPWNHGPGDDAPDAEETESELE